MIPVFPYARAPMLPADDHGFYQTRDTLSAFPIRELSGLLGAIANDLCVGGIDKGIVGMELIGFASMVTQGAADVAWPNGQTQPIGSHTVIVGSSGAGKSFVFNTLKDPIDGYLTQCEANAEELVPPEFFIEDATRPALLQHLNDWPIANLFTDEGGILNTLLREAAATMAKLADSAPHRHARVSTGRMALGDYRFLMMVLEQPDIFESSKHLFGARQGGVGLSNRFLFAKALEPQMGSEIQPQRLSDSVAKRYAQRVRDLLSLTIGNVREKKQRPVLRLSPEALQFFAGLNGQMRQLQALNPGFQPISEYLSRHSERVLRLAGAMHVFEYGTDSAISQETVQAAAQIGRWSIDAFRALTYIPPQQSQAELDAEKLLEALQSNYWINGLAPVLRSNCRNQAPNLGMTTARFERALPLLAGAGKIHITSDRRGKSWIQVNPNFPRLFHYQ